MSAAEERARVRDARQKQHILRLRRLLRPVDEYDPDEGDNDDQ